MCPQRAVCEIHVLASVSRVLRDSWRRHLLLLYFVLAVLLSIVTLSFLTYLPPLCLFLLAFLLFPCASADNICALARVPHFLYLYLMVGLLAFWSVKAVKNWKRGADKLKISTSYNWSLSSLLKYFIRSYTVQYQLLDLYHMKHLYIDNFVYLCNYLFVVLFPAEICCSLVSVGGLFIHKCLFIICIMMLTI